MRELSDVEVFKKDDPDAGQKVAAAKAKHKKYAHELIDSHGHEPYCIIVHRTKEDDTITMLSATGDINELINILYDLMHAFGNAWDEAIKTLPEEAVEIVKQALNDMHDDPENKI